LLQNLCRDCGGSGICVHKHQKNKVSCARLSVRVCAVRQAVLGAGADFSPTHQSLPRWQCRKCQKLNTCGHKIARKLCSECKILRDAGPEALSLKIHEVLGVLEEEEALDSDHPAHAHINEKVEGLRIMALAYVSAPLQTAAVQQEKQKQLMLQRKRKRDEMLTGYGMGMYAGLPPDTANQEQYQQMAANYYQQMQLMQQQMSRKPSKMAKKAAMEMNRNSADRYSPLISLLVARRVHCALRTRTLLLNAQSGKGGRDPDLSGIMVMGIPSACDGCTHTCV